MHRTFLKLLTNYSSEKTPSDRNTSSWQAITLQTRSEVKEMPLMSSLLYLLHSVEGQLQVSYISLPEGKIFFFPPEIRYQKPYEIVFTVSVSNRLDHLSTAAGCYMHRHTFSCCKFLFTCIFSGFQKQFLGAERQY